MVAGNLTNTVYRTDQVEQDAHIHTHMHPLYMCASVCVATFAACSSVALWSLLARGNACLLQVLPLATRAPPAATLASNWRSGLSIISRLTCTKCAIKVPVCWPTWASIQILLHAVYIFEIPVDFISHFIYFILIVDSPASGLSLVASMLHSKVFLVATLNWIFPQKPVLFQFHLPFEIHL